MLPIWGVSAVVRLICLNATFVGQTLGGGLATRRAVLRLGLSGAESM
jgi:hypothetical protein